MSDSDYLDRRLTESRNPRTVGIDVATAAEIVDIMHREDMLVADAVYRCRDEIATAITAAERALSEGGRLVYVGAGTSGRLGVLDASECPPTFGADPRQVVGLIAGGVQALVKSQEGAEDDADAAVRDLGAIDLEERDVVIGIAASGSTPYVAAALRQASSTGCFTAIVACSTPPSELVANCDTVIEVVTGPEVLTGSTRLKAGTATKIVLNMISTGAMIRNGKAYGNLMVDLMATSRKLVDRGERIVMEVCNVDRETARMAIDSAAGSVKVAIVMTSAGIDRAEAVRLLEDNAGVTRAVIGPPPDVEQ